MAGTAALLCGVVGVRERCLPPRPYRLQQVRELAFPFTNCNTQESAPPQRINKKGKKVLSVGELSLSLTRCRTWESSPCTYPGQRS